MFPKESDQLEGVSLPGLVAQVAAFEQQTAKWRLAEGAIIKERLA